MQILKCITGEETAEKYGTLTYIKICSQPGIWKLRTYISLKFHHLYDSHTYIIGDSWLESEHSDSRNCIH